MTDWSTAPGLSPEQQDTARLVSELLGKAIAARYEDFCRLSMGVFALNVSRPVAAHALRELESMLRGVLAAPLDAVRSESPDSKEKQSALRRALKELGCDDENQVSRALDALAPRFSHKDQIRRIVTRLGFEPDGDIAKLWIGIVNNYQIAHERSFHESLEIDRNFRTSLQQPFDTVIRAIVEALRGRYAALVRRVHALAAIPDRGHAVKLFAKEIPGAMQLQWQFFRNLESGDWLPHLRTQGLLGEPAQFAGGEGQRFYGEWPAGDYLLRMARSDDARVRHGVTSALQALESAVNPDVLRGSIDILVALPPSEAATLTGLALCWIRQGAMASNATACTDLVKRLADASESAAAMKLAREVFRLWEEGGRVKSHFTEYMYEHHLPLLSRPLAVACGRGALELLVDCLRTVVTIQYKDRYIFVPDASVAEVNTPPFDIADVLKAAVLETAQELVRTRVMTTREVVGDLLGNEQKIFIRLALYVLAQDPASAPDLAKDFLLRAEWSTGTWCNPEYAALARAWFPSLTDDEQRSILRVIDAVPGQHVDRWKAYFEQQHQRPPSLEDIERFTGECTRELLWNWRIVLPAARREVLEKLGEPEDPFLRFDRPDESPLTQEDFATRPVTEIVQFLRTWHPSLDGTRLTSNALGQQLRAAATERPDAFSAAAREFADLRPIYIRRLLEGLHEGAGGQQGIDWENVLALTAQIYNQASIRSDDGSCEDDRTEWGWTAKAASELLLRALRLSAPGVGIEHRGRVRELVNATFALVPQQIEMDNFEEEFERHGYFTAQRTFCGIATELYILLVRWENLNAATTSGGTKSAVRDNPQVSKILDNQLADCSPYGRIPRAIMGRYLGLFYGLDPDWVRSRLPLLFPIGDYGLRNAAWSAHLISDRGPITALLSELGHCYEEEIARLAEAPEQDSERDHRGQRLAEYLMVLELRGELPEQLLERFLESASDNLRRRAMWFVGRHLSLPSEELANDMRARGKAYWERRLAAASADPDKYQHELGIIDYWCSQGDGFDEEWLGKQLLAMVSIGLVPNTGYYAVDWLANFAARHVDLAVRIFLGLVQNGREKPYIYMTTQTAVRSILTAGRERGNSDTALRVSRIISHLASLGDASCLDLDLPE